PELHRRADAFGIAGERVDGDDLEAVIEATGRLLDSARSERRPAVLEAVTYRYRGHSVADAGLAYRSKAEIAAHMERDSVVRVRDRLFELGATAHELDAVDVEAGAKVAVATAAADASSRPAAGA